jgi:hypothetical protein
MKIAVLFNADDVKYDGFYGWPIREAILKTGVLQSAGTPIMISHGDVLTSRLAKSPADLRRVCEHVYFSAGESHLHAGRLRATYGQETVYACVLDGISEAAANTLHAKLSDDSAYLGLHAIDPSIPEHETLYADYMIDFGRFSGNTATLFFSTDSDDRDEGEAEELRALGFDVEWEDPSLDD